MIELLTVGIVVFILVGVISVIFAVVTNQEATTPATDESSSLEWVRIDWFGQKGALTEELGTRLIKPVENKEMFGNETWAARDIALAQLRSIVRDLRNSRFLILTEGSVVQVAQFDQLSYKLYSSVDQGASWAELGLSEQYTASGTL